MYSVRIMLSSIRRFVLYKSIFLIFGCCQDLSLTLTPPAKKQCFGMCCYLKTYSVMFAVNMMKPLSSHYFCHFLMSISSFDTPHKKQFGPIGGYYFKMPGEMGVTVQSKIHLNDSIVLLSPWKIISATNF